jgi:uncharacterized tellurite resistance protein B-like protein
LIAGIVVADDDLDETEDKFVDRMLRHFSLSSEERDALFPIMDAQEAADEFRALPNDVRLQAFDLLIEAAAVDGRYTEEEKGYLHAVADVIDIKAAEVDKRVAELLNK